MTKALNIVFIGTGNVAYHIAHSFLAPSHLSIKQAFNHRSSKEAKKFSKDFNCDLVTDYSKIISNADIYIIAVKDDSIDEVVKRLAALKLKGIVVHTSGSMEMSVLKYTSQKIGVYYPLETFYRGAKINWKQTPLLIEGNSKVVVGKLKYLASLVSEKVKEVNSKKRLQIHLAAVFACNFTNAMYVTAYQIIEISLNKNETDLLMPIMQHSFQKLEKIHPVKAQTGPAMRNDKLVMKKHLNLIKQNKQLTAVYKLLSDLIVAQQSSK